MTRQFKSRYKGGWSNVEEDCQLCRMSKETEWYFETQDWVVAEKLNGGPFVVTKSHQKILSDEEWQEMERIVRLAGFEDFHIDVRMGLVPDHWHGHIMTSGESVDLSDE